MDNGFVWKIRLKSGENLEYSGALEGAWTHDWFTLSRVRYVELESKKKEKEKMLFPVVTIRGSEIETVLYPVASDDQ